jgi:hypothetical protein
MDKVDVIGERWDYLIILDACRYDYFEEVYRDYLDGELTARISAGASTDEWRNSSFPDRYDDIIYISANPQISSTSKVYGYCAGEHFHKVYEVWNDQWDKEMGTVLPETLVRAAQGIIRETAGGGKRYIIHSLQPHSPYLSLADEVREFIQGDVDKAQRVADAYGDKPIHRFKQVIVRQLLRFLRRNDSFFSPPEWYLRKWFAMPVVNPMEAAWRSVGKEGMRKAYRENLIAVLKEVAVLIESLSGRIVVTSDHGELLGERFCYAHPSKSTNPILLTVPWLVIEKESKTGADMDHAEDDTKTPAPQVDEGKTDEEKQLAEKLKALGYFD